MAINIPIITEFDGKGIQRAIKEFKQLETSSQKAQFAISKAAVPAAAALTGLGSAAFKAANLAADLREEQSKVGVVFGSSSKAIVDFSKTTAKALGQSQTQALKAAGTFGVLRSPLRHQPQVAGRLQQQSQRRAARPPLQGEG